MDIEYGQPLVQYSLLLNTDMPTLKIDYFANHIRDKDNIYLFSTKCNLF